MVSSCPNYNKSPSPRSKQFKISKKVSLSPHSEGEKKQNTKEMTLYTMVMVMILYNLDIVDFVHALLNNTVVLCLDDVFVSCMNSL